MKDLAEAALNAAQVKGAAYADVRLDEHVQQDIIVKNGQLAAVSDDASEGFGVRVLVDGAWGFAGSSRLNKNEIEEVVDRAIRIARASARVRSAPVDLGPPVTSPDDRKSVIRLRTASVIPIDCSVNGLPFGAITSAPAFTQRLASGISEVMTISSFPARSAIQSSAASIPEPAAMRSISGSCGTRMKLPATTLTGRPWRPATR